LTAATGFASEETALRPYQGQLLDIAFSAASAMPVFPHIKNRSRAQEVVVHASLELNQPERARGYIEKIDNWRRGAGYAELGLHYAKQGASDQVEPCLKLAAGGLTEAEGWRKDRIKAGIAAARAELEDRSADTFDQKIALLGKQVTVEDFDVVKGALAGYAGLYDCFYANAQRRDRVEGKIKASWADLPIFVRIDLLMELAEASLAHQDRAKALELVNEAQAMMDSARWPVQAAIPLKARLASLRFRAGDETAAAAQVQDALTLFESKRQTIVNIYRAGMLRPIAEAFQSMGRTETALNLYKRAIEAGMENPNSRPRADDLVATCCSMAVHGLEPDSASLARIREIHDGLSDPW